jgi:DNA modification methylase
VDLIYLDPPFNSNATYNILFAEKSGEKSAAQITAFEDTWHWDLQTERVYEDLVLNGPTRVGAMISALRQFIGTNQMMAYLVMMAVRLVELHRVLKSTGSLYLHCDPTASHYLKILLDTIFGVDNFRSEIIWKRSSAHSDTKQGRKQHGRIHDLIFYYTKSHDWVWNPVFTEYDESYINNFYRHLDEVNGRRYRKDNLTAAKPGGDTRYEWRVKKPAHSDNWEHDLDNEYLHPREGWEYKGVPPYKGRFWAYSFSNMADFSKKGRLVYSKNGFPSFKRYLDEMPGVPLQDIWDDIPPIGSISAERLGYATQKPLSLLERIIKSSSNPGDLVLDPFCGCGTAVEAAEKLHRRWVGIDITHLAITLIKYRIQFAFPDAEFNIIGEPESLEAARHLAQEDRFQFQWWSLSLIRARPVNGEPSGKRGKKGADQGIDGVINFMDDRKGSAKKVIISVKSGNVTSRDIRDLVGTIDREKSPIGALITLEKPSGPMVREAASAGFYHSELWDKSYPKIQILTVEDLLAGAEIQMPPQYATFKDARRQTHDSDAQQLDLLNRGA